MVINTNIEAQATANNLNASQLQLAKSLARLSSGSKIIVPSDDAAGLAVSSRLNSQIKRLDSALNNVVNAVSFTQTQDGFMKTIDKAFRGMGELAMLAQDTTKSDEDRALYNQEFAQLKDYVSETTKQDFNGVSLFAGKTLDVTVDADGTTFTMVGINLSDPTYTSSTNTGTDAWRLTSDAYMLSKDGYKAGATTYKSSVDLWRGLDGTWASTDNGGAKIAAGTYTTEDIHNIDTAAKTIAKDNFISKGTLNAGFNTDFAKNQLEKAAGHGMSTGDSLSFSTNAPAGTTAGTTYYVNAASTTGLTLHATLSDANANANVIDLTRSEVSAAKASVLSSTTALVAQQDTITVTAGNHTGDTFTVTANGQTTAAIASVPAVAQVDTITVTAGNHVGDTFATTVNGTATAAIASVVGDNNATASAMQVAITAIAGVTATVSGNVITITADTAGTALTGATSVALANTDGANATAPTVATATANKTVATANNETAIAINTAVNALTGLSSAVVNNVITITAANAGTALIGATSVARANTDGANATAPTVVSPATATTYSFTKSSHGLSVGDQVTVTKNAPNGFNAGTTYHVVASSTNGFNLAETHGGAAVVPTSAVVNMEYTTDTIAGSSNGAAAPNDSGIVTVATGHYLNTGDKVMLNGAHGGKAAGDAFFINKVDATNFKIYDTAANARLGGATGLQTFTATGAVRFSLTDTETNVATLNQSNQLKAGMFITANPIITGEDKDAVLAKTGDVININKTVQDINAFANELGVNFDDVNLKSVEAAQTALILVKTAITQVATDRAKLGAVQSRLNFTNEQLTVTKENLSAAISRISDVDVAEEATNYARYQILVASGTEMLKQANQLPQSALQLLR